MIKLKLTIIYCICICQLLTSGCRDSATSNDSSHVYADYYIRYLAGSQQLKAEARFLEGADLQTAEPKILLGGLNFLGRSMDLQTERANQHKYTFTDTLYYPEELQFQYREEAVLQNQAFNMTPLAEFFIDGDFSKQNGLALVAEGSVLKGNERLILLFTDVENRLYSTTVEGPTSDIKHDIAPEALPSDLPEGPISLYLLKRMKKTMAQSRQTITASIEYYTDTLQVQFVP